MQCLLAEIITANCQSAEELLACRGRVGIGYCSINVSLPLSHAAYHAERVRAGDAPISQERMPPSR